MATTDSNGLPIYQTTDPVAPLQTVLNGITTGVSAALDARTPIYPVANTTARSALVASLGWTPSATRPLYVHRADASTGLELERTTDGTTWLTIPAGAATYNATVAAGWSGTVRVQKIGPMAFVIGNVVRTGGDLDCQAWAATPVLSGLPPAMLGSDNQSLVWSNMDEFPAFYWNVTTDGVAAMGCRWIPRRITNGTWHQINHAYLTQ